MSGANKILVDHVKMVCKGENVCFYDVARKMAGWNKIRGPGCSNPKCDWLHGQCDKIKMMVLEGTGVCCLQEATGEVCTHETCGCAATREEADARAVKIGLVPAGVSNYERTAKQREKWIKKASKEVKSGGDPEVEMTKDEQAFMEDAFDEMLEEEDVDEEFAKFQEEEENAMDWFLSACEYLARLDRNALVKENVRAAKKYTPTLGCVADLVADYELVKSNWSEICGYC